MSLYYINQKQVRKDNIEITGEDYHHLAHVLRIKSGHKLKLSDQEKFIYDVVITEISRDTLTAKITHKSSFSLSRFQLILCPALIKSDNFSQIIRQATELGVDVIQPIVTEYTVVSLKNNKLANKLERWQKIAKSAAGQAERPISPQILEPAGLSKLPFNDFRFVIAGLSRKKLPTINQLGLRKDGLSMNDSGKVKVAMIIGPEGGFSPTEIDLLQERPCQFVSISPFILRAETANCALISQVQGVLAGQDLL
jgi:16S rRNA (uracil1498-N3)-methyltransferase